VENRLTDALRIALTLQRDFDRESCNHEHSRVFPIDQPLRLQNPIERLGDDWNIIGRKYSLGFQERPNRHDLPPSKTRLTSPSMNLQATKHNDEPSKVT
jgi:hypothetical protein